VHRITEDDEYFRMVRERWNAALQAAHRDIPAPEWATIEPVPGSRDRR
jgi:putative proteasome-type protease